MNPFENKALQGFCGCTVNGFNPAISYSLAAKNLTVTDASVFPSGETFKAANIWAIDKDGTEVKGHIAAAGGNAVLDLSGSDFDISGGFTITATVVSSKRTVGDLSIRGVGLALATTEGSLQNKVVNKKN